MKSDKNTRLAFLLLPSLCAEAKRCVMITVSEEKNTISFSNLNFFQQIFYEPKVQRQVQKSPTSIGGEMNADLSYFSTGVQTPAERS